MARTIAEILAYKRNYSPELNPALFDEDGQMYSEVRDKIEEIVDAFLDYTQIKDDVKVLDIRVVGSNASYNYNENSDLDIHIVTDLSKISKPETIAQLYFTEVKHAFKEAYDITIKGIDVELYVEDVNASAVTNGIYSVMQDKWIKEPTPMEDPTDDEIARAEDIEDEILTKLEQASDEEKDDIIDQLYVMRKDGLASEGETAPANLAFKSLRNKGIIKRAKDDIKKAVSKKLSLESKKLKEDTISYTTDRAGEINHKLSNIGKRYLDYVKGRPDYIKEYIEADNRKRNLMARSVCDLWEYWPGLKEDEYHTIMTYLSLQSKGVSESKRVRESRRLLRSKKLKEDLEQTLTLGSKKDLIEYLNKSKIEKYKEYIVCTKDGYDCYVTWSYSKIGTHERKPIVMLTYNGDIIFKEEGEGDLFAHAVKKLEGVRESKRIREMSRKPNKYWIYTEDYSFLKRDEVERAEFLYDSDNTSAYGPEDLIYKLNQLKSMNIKVKKIWQTYADDTSKDVTDKYRKYL